LLGKKPGSRMKKELDHISEEVRIPLFGCRRQYDNFKRIYKYMEEREDDLVAGIRDQFLISAELARYVMSLDPSDLLSIV
jgi:hypothetical protein